MLPAMATFKDVVEVKERPWNRVIKVTITAPDISLYKEGSKEVQVLAEKAWRSVNKKITIGELTVKAEAFGR